VDRLEHRLRRQAEDCASYGSALLQALLSGAADELADGGIVADLLGPHAEDPVGSALPLRFAGALHRLVLERRAPELALHYPSVGGSAPVEAVWPAAERACREHLDLLRELVRRPVQTNEVGRSAVLVGVLAHVAAATGLPVRLLEVGASAGLNLRCDAYRYDVAGGVVLGDADSPVRLRQPWADGPHPSGPVPRVVQRAGCDPAPVDPTTGEGRLTLTSYVWADQRERLERLRGALAVAARVPADVTARGAADWVREVLATPVDGVATVLWHSVVRQYLDADERTAMASSVSAAGRRATAGAPLVHAAMEPERFGERDVVFRVHAGLWPGPGAPVHLADCHGHGPPVRWTGSVLGRTG
jgi:hypothetical protein